MKTVTVNVQIQINVDEISLSNVKNTMDEINQIILYSTNNNPQIFVENIDESDIFEITDNDEDY